MTPPSDETHAARSLRAGGEAVLLLLATAPAWPFASVQAVWEFPLTVAVAALAVLWAAHAVVTQRFTFRVDVATVALGGLILWAALQTVPLPPSVVRVVSPGAAAANDTFRPSGREVLPGDTPVSSQPEWRPLSVDPNATRIAIARLTGLLLVYAAARNWLATPAAFRRLAIAATLNGLALAVVALMQFFSSPRGTVFWTFDAGESVFGPFVNRNHFPDFVAVCLGFGVGLMLSLRTSRRAKSTDYDPGAGQPLGFVDALLAPFKLLDQPWPLAAAGAVGLMAVSILFSLSRGGVAAVIAGGLGCWLLARAGRPRDGTANGGGWAVGLAVGVGLLLAGWFGWGPVQDRFATLLKREQADDRTELWASAIRSGGGFWAVGSGHGTFVRVETLGRITGRSDIANDRAHNEYLEAALEGGVVRLALTLLLVIGVLVTVARGYWRQRSRPGGSLLLGAWFGMAVLAAHAVTDFAIQMPAVAVLAAAVAGMAMAVGTATEMPRERKKVRVKVRQGLVPLPPGGGGVRGGGEGETRILSEDPLPPNPPPTRGGDKTGLSSLPQADAGTKLAGPLAFVFALIVAVAGVLVALDARSRARSERYLAAAEAFRRSDAPDRTVGRIAYLEARTRVRPNDPTAWLDLAAARIDRAGERSLDVFAAATGPILAARPAAEFFPEHVVTEEVVPALRALRQARDLCPLFPEVQFRLGVFARYFTRADPPLAYLDRAKRLLVVDAEVWYACGAEALRAGDEPTAWANWKESLALSDRMLTPILRRAGPRLSPEQLHDRILPDDPLVLLTTADALYPEGSDRRKPLLEAAAKGHPVKSPEAAVAVARALGELGRTADAVTAWKKAVNMDERRADIRDNFARWLEDEELYAEAVEQLAWLAERKPDDERLRQRSQVACHGAALQEAIRGK